MTIFIIIGVISGLATFILWCACALGKQKENEFHEAFSKMVNERKEKEQYNLTETFTSGCPVIKE